MAIPTDIQKAAEAVYAHLGRGPDADEQAIAKALQAERERCALHADAYLVGLQDKGGDVSAKRIVNDAIVGTASLIAQAIRNGDPAHPAIRTPAKGA